MLLMIRPLEERDVAWVVSLHRTVMGYSINALLGVRHLAFVYRTTAALPDTFVRVAADGASVLGAVSATMDEQHTAHALPCPVSERLEREGFYLPSALALRHDDIAQVITAVRAVLA